MWNWYQKASWYSFSKNNIAKYQQKIKKTKINPALFEKIILKSKKSLTAILIIKKTTNIFYKKKWDENIILILYLLQ